MRAHAACALLLRDDGGDVRGDEDDLQPSYDNDGSAAHMAEQDPTADGSDATHRAA